MSRELRAFHFTLGLVVLLDSLRTAVHAAGAGRSHLLALASLETLAAALFLLPGTLRLGAVLLLAVFAVAFAAHAWRAEFAGALLVYAAGALLVMRAAPRRLRI